MGIDINTELTNYFNHKLCLMLWHLLYKESHVWHSVP